MHDAEPKLNSGVLVYGLGDVHPQSGPLQHAEPFHVQSSSDPYSMGNWSLCFSREEYISRIIKRSKIGIAQSNHIVQCIVLCIANYRQPPLRAPDPGSIPWRSRMSNPRKSPLPPRLISCKFAGVAIAPKARQAMRVSDQYPSPSGNGTIQDIWPVAVLVQ